MLNEKMGSNKTNAPESHFEVSEEMCTFLEKNFEIIRYLIKNLILVAKYTDNTIIRRQDISIFSDLSDVDNEEESTTELENDIKCCSSKLKNSILNLQQVFPQADVLKQNNEFRSSSESEDLSKFDNIDARADMLNNVSNFSNEISELLANLIKLYKTDRDVKAAKIIKKKISKIYKSLKLLPHRIDPDKNNTSSTSKSKLVYLNAEHNLSLYLSYLIRKISRVIKTFKKNFNMDTVQTVQSKYPRSEIVENNINLESENILTSSVNQQTSQERQEFHEHENNGYLNRSELRRLQESVLRNAEDLNEIETWTKNIESDDIQDKQTQDEIKETLFSPVDLVEVQSQESCNTNNEASPRKRKKKFKNTVKEEDPIESPKTNIEQNETEFDNFYIENYLSVEIDENTINFRIGDEVLSNVSVKKEKDNSITSDSPKKRRHDLQAIDVEEMCNNIKTEKETTPKKKRKRSNERVDDKENYSNNEINKDITETTTEIFTSRGTKEISNNCMSADNIKYQSDCEVNAEVIISKKDRKKLKKMMKEKQTLRMEETSQSVTIDLTENVNTKKKNKKSKTCDKDVTLISDDVSSEKIECTKINSKKRKNPEFMDDANTNKVKNINKCDKYVETHTLEINNEDIIHQHKKKKKSKCNNQSSEDDVRIVYESVDLTETSKNRFKNSDIILDQDASTDSTKTDNKHSKKSKREKSKNKPAIFNHCVEQVYLTSNNNQSSDEIVQIVHKKSSKNNDQYQEAKSCNDNVIVNYSDRRKKSKRNEISLNEDELTVIEDDEKKESKIEKDAFKAKQNESIALDAIDLQKETSRLLEEYRKRLEEENVENENGKIKNSKNAQKLQDGTEFTVTAGDFKMAYNIIMDKNLSDNDKYLHLLEIYQGVHNKQEISSDIIEKLSNLYIIIDWTVPPVHEVDTPLSSSARPSDDQKKKLLELGAKFNVTYTDKEDNIIKANWKSFCQRYNMIDNPKLFFSAKVNGKVLPADTRKKFLQYLARGLPDRYLISVYRRFNLLHKPYKTGRFTPEEDRLILEHMRLFNGNFKRSSLLAPVLNRDKVAIEHRYFILKQKEEENQMDVGWDLDAMTEMLKNMMEILDLTNVDDLRTAELPSTIFHDVAVKMNRTQKSVYQCWYKKLYVRLFSEERLCNEEIKIKLLETLYELRAQHQTRIDWDNVLSKFPKGFTKEFLAAQLAILKTTFQLQRGEKSHLSDCIKYLRTHFVPYLSNKVMKITPRLRFKDGTLEEYE